MADIVEKLSKYVAGMGVRDASQYTAFATAQEIGEAIAEIERLREKCDKQAKILQRLTPDNYPCTIFIHAEIGPRDVNNMPEKLLVVPSYGVDFSYVYVRTEKTVGPEW